MPAVARGSRLALLVGGVAAWLGCAQLPISTSPILNEPPLPRFVSAEAAAASAYMRGRIFQREGRWAEALAAFNQAVELAPDDLPSQRAVTELAMRLGRTDLALSSAETARSLAPDDPDVQRDFIGVLVAAEQLERAVDLLEQQLEASKDELDPDMALGLVSMYVELERDSDAEALARRMIEGAPADVSGYIALGTVLERTKRLDEAEKCYRKAFDKVELDPRLYDGLARVARARGDTDREIELLRNKLDLLPGDPGTLGRLVEIYSEREDRGALISVIEEIVYYNRGNARAQLQLGILYLQAGRLDDAIDSFEQLSRGFTPQSEIGAQARYLLGRIYARIGQSEPAISLLGSIPSDAPTYVESQLALVALLQDEQRYEEALSALDRALERSDSMPLQLQRAQLLQLSGRTEEGVALIEGLIDRYPGQAGELYYQLGMLHTNAGKDELALQTMLQALALAPDNPNVMNFVGYVWADRGERLDEAEGLIRGAVAQRPEDGFIVDSLGWVLYKRGLQEQRLGRIADASESFGGAVRELERARKLVESGDVTIERHLGDVYQTMLRYTDALTAYQNALELGPADDEAEQIRSEIARVQRYLEQSGTSGPVD